MPVDVNLAPIAVVGIAARLPGAPDPDAFWRLLSDGRSAIGTPPAARQALTGSRPGGWLDRVDTFDADFFGISPREARHLDPQQRLMLELCWEAIEDAGIAPARLAGSPVGVFAGAMATDYATLAARAGAADVDRFTLTGLNRGLLANRVSFTLGLRGPSFTVDAAQASSLVAVQLAVQSLRRGESDVALAGGVNLNLVADSTLAAEAFGGLSPNGRSATFDAAADGYVRGEGGAVVLLKPSTGRSPTRIRCTASSSAARSTTTARPRA
ncbi:beta-ketoacyl [acyl carrier protein] synthase domain-containing protein [Dactylosporangium cerinum]